MLYSAWYFIRQNFAIEAPKGSILFAGFRLDQTPPQHGFLILQRGLNRKYAVLWVSYDFYEGPRGIYYCEDTSIYGRDFLVVMGDECDLDFYTAEYQLSYPGRMVFQQRSYEIGPDRSFLRFIEKAFV